jgi:hypothetical protein
MLVSVFELIEKLLLKVWTNFTEVAHEIFWLVRALEFLKRGLKIIKIIHSQPVMHGPGLELIEKPLK